MSILDQVAEITRRNKLARWLTRVDYPFACRLPSRHAKRAQWADEIRTINNICYDDFVGDIQHRPARESVVSMERLAEWQRTSRNSWLTVKGGRGGAIVGYVHVEPLRGMAAQAILEGREHEGGIKKVDILKDGTTGSDDYIHIGCIAASANGASKTTAAKLLTAAADRVDQLYAKSGYKCHRVLAADYRSCDGRHHATQLLRGFGFEEKGVTSEGDRVFVLDLGRPQSQMLRQMLQAVRSVRAHTRAIRNRWWRRGLLVTAVLMFFLSVLSWVSSGEFTTASNIIGIVGTVASVAGVVVTILADRRISESL